jgi:hypothetical protein
MDIAVGEVVVETHQALPGEKRCPVRDVAADGVVGVPPVHEQQVDLVRPVEGSFIGRGDPDVDAVLQSRRRDDEAEQVQR